MPGLETRILTGLHGERMMMVLSSTLPGLTVPVHKHSHEQIGIVYSGRARLRSGDRERIVEKGDFYCIPANVPHSDTCLGKSRSSHSMSFAPSETTSWRSSKRRNTGQSREAGAVARRGLPLALLCAVSSQTHDKKNNSRHQELELQDLSAGGQVMPALICKLVHKRLCRVVTADKTPVKEFLHDSGGVLAGFLQSVGNLAGVLRAFSEQSDCCQLRSIELKFCGDWL